MRGLSDDRVVAVVELLETEIMSVGNSAMLTIHGAMSRLLTEAARRVPGLSEGLEAALTRVGNTGRRSVLGQFRSQRWDAPGATRLHEILIADHHLGADVEEVADTLLHELAHLLADVRGLRDTSNRGRYHNAKFKLCAQDIGLVVRYEKPFGYRTLGLSSELRMLLAGTLLDLEHSLVLKLANPRRLPPEIGVVEDLGEAPIVKRKFVFAICGCVDARDRYQPVRVAVGRWRPRSIYCVVCGTWFRDPEESLTNLVNAGPPRPMRLPPGTVSEEIPLEKEVRVW